VRKKGHGGVDWYRYQQVILKGKLFPWVNELKTKGLDPIVQEDGAPAHSSKYQQEVFDAWKITRMAWPGNSPDLNAIEPTWFWMKKETTKKGVKGKNDMKNRWLECWRNLPKEMIQAWIGRIPLHIQRVLQLRGGNEYQEGRFKGQEKASVY
jgi:hypothetical protein